MLSPALRYRKKRLAQQALIQEAENRAQPLPATPASYSEDVLAAALNADLDRLSALDSVADKVALKKAELLPKYLPHVNSYLASGAHSSHPLMVRVAIWALDVEDLENALRLANACIEQQQLAPAHFKRDLPTFFAEGIAEWAERELKAGRSAAPYIDAVGEQLLANQWPVAEPIVRGKVFKVLGQLAEAAKDYQSALRHYEQAMQENHKAGCKTRIEKMRALVAAH